MIITILDTDGNLVRRYPARGRWHRDRAVSTIPVRHAASATGAKIAGASAEATRREGRRDDRREGARFGYDGSVFSFRIDIPSPAPPPVPCASPQDRYVVDYGDVYER